MKHPQAPETNARSTAWAVATAIAVFFATLALAPFGMFAIIPSALLAAACLYLVGGEMILKAITCPACGTRVSWRYWGDRLCEWCERT